MLDSALAEAIAREFNPDEAELKLVPLGNGLINDTYLVTNQSRQWVLQRINKQVFSEPWLLMENLATLTRHVGNKNKSAGLSRLQVPAVINTAQNKAYFTDAEGNYWRALQFIANSYSKEQCENLQDAGQIGWALGYFHALCSDPAPLLLHDTLPGFHIAPGYYKAYQQALVCAKQIQKDEDYAFCVSFINAREALINVLEDAKQNGELTLRVIHGDPKVNNFLFDQQCSEVISLIDLDTVKPGLVHYDIGDCLRSACFNADTEAFDLSICEAVLKSYLNEVKHFFSEADYRYLYAAIHLIPLELGMRFFTDYLQGNQYFKVAYPTQNLSRAIQQFRLCSSIEQQQSSIEQLIQRLR